MKEVVDADEDFHGGISWVGAGTPIPCTVVSIASPPKPGCDREHLRR